jgi:hypothetical protein
MSDKEQRKASDVLLSIESKIDTVLKLMANYDFTNKLILSKLNVLNTISNLDSANSIPPVINSPITSNVESNIPIISTPSIIKRNVNQENAKEMELEEFSNKKIPVIQRVVDDKGKDLFMAEVSIMTLDKELVNKTKTNAMGKWQAQLKPGKYLVQIIKTNTETKEKKQSLQEIVIDGTKQTMQLPTAIINK